MSKLFVPTQADVQHYIRLRAISKEKNKKISKLIPRHAFHEIGQALGILQDDTLILDTEDTIGVLMDCCIFDWIGPDGKTVIEQYVERYPAKPGTDEHVLQQGYLKAQYRALLVNGAREHAGVYCTDLFNGEQLFVMDVSLSQTVMHTANILLASRTIPLGDYAMTGGAALPLSADVADTLEYNLERFRQKSGSTFDVHKSTLLLVRSALDAGANQRVAYDDPTPGRKLNPKQLRLPTSALSSQKEPTISFIKGKKRPSGAPARNAPCPCGSGRKYKKCCEGKETAEE